MVRTPRIDGERPKGSIPCCHRSAIHFVTGTIRLFATASLPRTERRNFQSPRARPKRPPNSVCAQWVSLILLITGNGLPVNCSTGLGFGLPVSTPARRPVSSGIEISGGPRLVSSRSEHDPRTASACSPWRERITVPRAGTARAPTLLPTSRRCTSLAEANPLRLVPRTRIRNQ